MSAFALNFVSFTLKSGDWGSLGDVIVEGDDLYGNGVNVAARLEGIAQPGGICISANVHEHARNTAKIGFEDLGEQEVKNIAHPLHAYRVVLDGPVSAVPVEAAAASGPLLILGHKRLRRRNYSCSASGR